MPLYPKCVESDIRSPQAYADSALRLLSVSATDRVSRVNNEAGCARQENLTANRKFHKLWLRTTLPSDC